mgnify:CR=1 FL=1
MQNLFKKIGLEKYVVPTIAIFDSIENARIFLIKSDLICKPTHLSGQYFFIKGSTENPSKFNESQLQLMQSWLDRTYYTSSRERHYRFLKRKIILEPILFEDKNLKDYKNIYS